MIDFNFGILEIVNTIRNVKKLLKFQLHFMEEKICIFNLFCSKMNLLHLSNFDVFAKFCSLLNICPICNFQSMPGITAPLHPNPIDKVPALLNSYLQNWNIHIYLNWIKFWNWNISTLNLSYWLNENRFQLVEHQTQYVGNFLKLQINFWCFDNKDVLCQTSILYISFLPVYSYMLNTNNDGLSCIIFLKRWNGHFLCSYPPFPTIAATSSSVRDCLIIHLALVGNTFL